MTTNHIDVRDLAQAVFLVVQNHPYEIVPLDGDLVAWRFPNSEEVRADTLSFMSGEGTVVPVLYEQVRARLLREARAASVRRDL